MTTSRRDDDQRLLRELPGLLPLTVALAFNIILLGPETTIERVTVNGGWLCFQPASCNNNQQRSREDPQ